MDDLKLCCVHCLKDQHSPAVTHLLNVSFQVENLKFAFFILLNSVSRKSHTILKLLKVLNIFSNIVEKKPIGYPKQKPKNAFLFCSQVEKIMVLLSTKTPTIIVRLILIEISQNALPELPCIYFLWIDLQFCIYCGQ